MMLIARNIGRLGNRLILFAHFIALAREHNVGLANPCFVEYANQFPATRSQWLCRYGDAEKSATDVPDQIAASGCPNWLRNGIRESVYLPARMATHLHLTRFPVRIFRLSPGQTCDLQSAEVVDSIGSRRIVLFMGWRFRCTPLVTKHAAAIRHFFRFDDSVNGRVDTLQRTARRDVDRLIGIHIRHGDYATFANGRYHYSLDSYARWMHQVREQYPGQKLRFVVCSDSPIDTTAFGGLDWIRGPGTIVDDLAILSRCEQIIGPPSTFTLWSSFLGNVPFIHMRAKTENFGVDQLTISQLDDWD